jgi:PAXNEB protein
MFPYSISNKPLTDFTSYEDNQDGWKNSINGPSFNQISELVNNLPRNLHWDKVIEKTVDLDHLPKPLETLEEDDEDNEAEDGLQIAWQYRKKIQDQRLGHNQAPGNLSKSSQTRGETFCHSFDFNGRLKDQDFNQDCIQLFNALEGITSKIMSNRELGFFLFQSVCSQLKVAPRGKLIRLVLFQVPVNVISIALPLILTHIRSTELPVVTLVTIQPWRIIPSHPTDLINLQRTADVVLQVESFVSRRYNYPPPNEFRHLDGLLCIPKVSTVTAATANGGGHFANMTVTKRPQAHIYGLKRDRRKLHISLLHIPPEDYHDAGGGGVRSGSGNSTKGEKALCSSGTGNSLLDF